MKSLVVSDANHYARFAAAQYQHSLVVRDIEREFVDIFINEGLGSIPWGPLGGGFLSGNYRRSEQPEKGRLATTPDHDEEAWFRRNSDQNWHIIDVIGEIAEANGKSSSQVALRWLLDRPEVSSVIMGVRTPEQLEDNLGAVVWSLGQDKRDRLDAASVIKPGDPYRMMTPNGNR